MPVRTYSTRSELYIYICVRFQLCICLLLFLMLFCCLWPPSNHGKEIPSNRRHGNPKQPTPWKSQCGWSPPLFVNEHHWDFQLLPHHLGFPATDPQEMGFPTPLQPWFLNGDAAVRISNCHFLKMRPHYVLPKLSPPLYFERVESSHWLVILSWSN